MNVLIDDASPQIRYYKGDSLSVGWITEHTPKSKYPDTLISRYSESTFHGTFGEGDYMEYRFNGTGVTVYGAKRDNHGVYGVKIDDNPEERYDGKGKDNFQAVLYQKMGMDEGAEHVIRMTNYPSATPNVTRDIWFDIDHILITHTIPSTTYTTYIDDASPSISYDTSWVSYGYGTGGYYNLTEHMSSTTGSIMELKFNGSSIQLFSSINTDHGDYTISLDGGEQEVYSGNNWQLLYQVPIYTISGLTEGEHTITITNQGVSPQNVVGFDFAMVNSSVKPPETESIGMSSTGYTSPPTSSIAAGAGNTSSGQSSSSLNIGALAGGISAGVVLLALIIVLVIWYFKRRKKAEDTTPYYSEGYRPGEPSTGRLDLVGHEVQSPSTQAPTTASRSYSHSNPNWTSYHSALATGAGAGAASLRDRKGHNIQSSTPISSGSPISSSNMREINHHDHPFLQNMHSRLSPGAHTQLQDSSPHSQSGSSSLPDSHSHSTSYRSPSPGNGSTSPFQYFSNHSRNNTLSSSSPLTNSPSISHQYHSPLPSDQLQYHSPVSIGGSTELYHSHSPNSSGSRSRTLPRTFGGSPISDDGNKGIHRNPSSSNGHSHSHSHSQTRIRDANDNPLPYTAAHAGPTPPYHSPRSKTTTPTDAQPDVDDHVNDVRRKERVGGGFAWG
ncbi:hypothetical protein I203_103474 [Kwoniella mangroviensis CBS 8507]|uniref:uncharacterized protein n=1 Tax=Kwoniella mangroviensis CBS 8507 TaxID=1296122 RepID=UPI00302C55C8